MAAPRNGLMAFGLLGVIAGMVGLSFASVPLYRMFCEATGYGGTPKTGPQAAPGASGRFITVRFNADVNGGMPWRFVAAQRELRVELGAESPAFYTARNLAATAVTGVSTWNVTPEKAAPYFNKTQCFCFNEQTIAAGGEAQFPLSFWVDPAIATDPNTADVTTITLNYTFFRSLEDAARTGALAVAGPHIGGGDAQRRTATS
jgi:cytochrome c oxidase assembly protein subunit 11